ncbi:MAG TPA: polysaccharide biosynthesis protein, partial [Pseudoflavonifractor sp.]|nr:polysaccharide biosynthesis protein [Pseudoflavonifractor sp.]
MSSSEKKNTFFGGAAILAVGVVLTKIIGAIYKIPLINILTDAAYADFSSAYTIYTFFLTISTAGLPVALSKTISEANALGRKNQTQKVFRVALLTFLALGVFSFFCMSVLAVPMSSLVVRNPKAIYCVLALAPSVLCVCIMAAFRGYFQGHFNMTPTSVSQVIESFLKLLIGLGLAVLITNMALQPADFGERMPAVGAIIGVSTGSVIALVYMIWTYLRHRRGQKSGTDRADSSKRILVNLLKLAIPITLGSGANALITVIDGSLVMTQLQRFYETAQHMDAGMALDAARALKGIYDKTMSVYNLPFSMMVPLTACIIPAVSAALARRDRREAQRVSESALRVGLLLALPMGMGLFALGGPIMGLLARGIDVSIAGPLLSILGIASIFVSLQLLCNSILQANGMVNLPILVVAIGGVVKIAVNYTLVGNPDILINGAPVGTLFCFLIMSVLDIFIIRRAIPAAPSFLKATLKPLLASVVMAAAAWASYG